VTSFRLEAEGEKWWKTVADVDRFCQNELINEITYPETERAVTLTDWSGWDFLPERFAGTVIYETSVNLGADDITGSATLIPELICGAVRVNINGQDIGHAMFAPFSFEIGDKLRAGENRITLAVSNTIGSNIKGKSGGLLSAVLKIMK